MRAHFVVMWAIVTLAGCSKGGTPAGVQTEIGSTGWWISLPEGVKVRSEPLGWTFVHGEVEKGTAMKSEVALGLPEDPRAECGLPEARDLSDRVANGKMTACENKSTKLFRVVAWIKRSDEYGKIKDVMRCRYNDASLETAIAVCQSMAFGKPQNH